MAAEQEITQLIPLTWKLSWKYFNLKKVCVKALNFSLLQIPLQAFSYVAYKEWVKSDRKVTKAFLNLECSPVAISISLLTFNSWGNESNYAFHFKPRQLSGAQLNHWIDKFMKGRREFAFHYVCLRSKRPRRHRSMIQTQTENEICFYSNSSARLSLCLFHWDVEIMKISRIYVLQSCGYLNRDFFSVSPRSFWDRSTQKHWRTS